MLGRQCDETNFSGETKTNTSPQKSHHRLYHQKEMNLSVTFESHPLLTLNTIGQVHMRKWEGLGRCLGRRVKCLPWNHETLSSEPRSHIRAGCGLGVHLGEWRKVDLEGLLLARTTKWERSKFNEHLLNKKGRKEGRRWRNNSERYPNIDCCHGWAHPPTCYTPHKYIHMQIHRQMKREIIAKCLTHSRL